MNLFQFVLWNEHVEPITVTPQGEHYLQLSERWLSIYATPSCIHPTLHQQSPYVLAIGDKAVEAEEHTLP